MLVSALLLGMAGGCARSPLLSDEESTGDALTEGGSDEALSTEERSFLEEMSEIASTADISVGSQEASASQESQFSEEMTEIDMQEQTGALSFSLSNPHFLQLTYAGDEAGYTPGTVYNGGNQSWFYNGATGEGDYQLENEGCGLIGAADTLLYIAQHHAGYEKLIPSALLAVDSPLDYAEYQSYVRGLRARADLFPFSVQLGGALGTSLAEGMTLYSQEQDCELRAEWGGRAPAFSGADYINAASASAMLEPYFEREELEETAERFLRKTNSILYMLEQDIPVIMAVGPFTQIELYQYDGGDEQRGSLVSAGNVSSHYFVVTGAEVDFDQRTITMEIETWGERYVIDYLTFSQDVYSGFSYLSDIVYIHLR